MVLVPSPLNCLTSLLSLVEYETELTIPPLPGLACPVTFDKGDFSKLVCVYGDVLFAILLLTALE
jgi:hypothetical protein